MLVKEIIMIRADGFAKNIKTIGSPDGGCECVFIKLTKTMGIKGYKTYDEAMYARFNQAMAYKNKVGPKVLSDVLEVIMPVIGTDLSYNDNITGCSRRLWAYKTQVVRMITDEEYDNEEGKYDKLEKKMHDIGLNVYDLHSNNIGWIGKRLVCIDFGYESMPE